MLIDELVINLARGSEAEDLSRSIVEHGLDVGEFLGRDGGQVGAFGQELADQPVDVFVGAALPGGVGLAEVHGHAGGGGELLVTGHLAAAVVGEAAAQLGDDAAEAAAEACESVVGGTAVHLGEQHVAAVALDGRADGAGVASAFDEVAFPMAGHGTGVGLGRALTQGHEIGDVAALAAGAARSRHALGVALPQGGDELCTQLTPGHQVDGLVDGLVRDVLGGIVGVHALEPAGDLLGRQGPLQLAQDVLAERAVEGVTKLAAIGLGLRSTRPGLLMRSRGQIAPLAAPIALELSADRRATSAHLGGNLALLQPPRQQ